MHIKTLLCFVLHCKELASGNQFVISLELNTKKVVKNYTFMIEVQIAGGNPAKVALCDVGFTVLRSKGGYTVNFTNKAILHSINARYSLPTVLVKPAYCIKGPA